MCLFQSQQPGNNAFMSCEPQFFGHIKVNCYSSFSALIWNSWHLLTKINIVIIFSSTIIGFGHFFDPSSSNKRLVWSLKRLILFSHKIIIWNWLWNNYIIRLSIIWIEPFHLGHINFFLFSNIWVKTGLYTLYDDKKIFCVYSSHNNMRATIFGAYFGYLLSFIFSIELQIFDTKKNQHPLGTGIFMIRRDKTNSWYDALKKNDITFM